MIVDLSELSSFVEAHPDDHEQRWRLAKKLYMNCQYRLALEHLLILKNTWRPRVNVVRYLAATYYRLGRYDDALRELVPGLERWPNELALHEQVARVYEITERYEAALEAWRAIQTIAPDHPMVARALTRLQAIMSDDKPQELPIGDSDSGIDIGGVVCAVCGAQNSVEFSRCWQCHALLDDRTAAATPAPQSSAPARTRTTNNRTPVAVVLGLIAVGLLSVDVYLTLSQLAAIQANAGSLALTLGTFLEREFAMSRAIVGAALAVLWPTAIVLAAKIVEPQHEGPVAGCVVTGLLAASLAYASTWAPWPWILVGPISAAVITLPALLFFLPITPLRAAGAWAIHGAVVVISVLSGFVALEGIAPVRDVGHLIQFSKLPPTDEPGTYRAPDLLVNEDLHITWYPSGSQWLDSLPHTAEFVLVDAPVGKPLYVELQQFGGVLAGRNVDSSRVSFRESPIRPGQDYVMRLTGPDDTPPVTLRVHSLFRAAFSR